MYFSVSPSRSPTSAELSYLAVQFVERVADKPVLTGYILNMLSKPVA